MSDPRRRFDMEKLLLIAAAIAAMLIAWAIPAYAGLGWS